MRRREKGTGTVFQLSDGKWLAKITQDGKTISRKAKTKSEAKQKLEEIQKEHKRIKRIERNALKSKLDTNSTVEEVFQGYIKSKKQGRNKIAETSLQRIESTVMTHILPRFGTWQFKELTSRDINSLLDELMNQGMSYSTVRKVYLGFSACFRYAMDEECIVDYSDNPMRRVSMPKEKGKLINEINYYNEEERRRIEAECLRTKFVKSTGKEEFVHKYGAAFVFIMNTGLREGEICGLTKDSVYLDENYFIVDKGVVSVKRDGLWVTVLKDSPKTKNSVRMIPLNATAKKMYEILLDTFPDGEMLISTSTGKIVAPTKLNQYFNRILKEANVEKRGGVHALRDTFATALFENGMDVLTVSKLLGHESTRVTEKHYIRVLEERRIKAVQLLDVI